MLLTELAPLECVALLEHELLLFAAVFFLVGSLDELAMDFAWGWLLLTGHARHTPIDRAEVRGGALTGPAAVLIAAWQEAQVLEFTIAHARQALCAARLDRYR